jgi:hypothetical protein
MRGSTFRTGESAKDGTVVADDVFASRSPFAASIDDCIPTMPTERKSV